MSGNILKLILLVLFWFSEQSFVWAEENSVDLSDGANALKSVGFNPYEFERSSYFLIPALIMALLLVWLTLDRRRVRREILPDTSELFQPTPHPALKPETHHETKN